MVRFRCNANRYYLMTVLFMYWILRNICTQLNTLKCHLGVTATKYQHVWPVHSHTCTLRTLRLASPPSTNDTNYQFYTFIVQ